MARLASVLYDLRHTFATRLAQAGMDAFTIAAILGHASTRVLQRYIHPTAKHQAEAMRVYEATLVRSQRRQPIDPGQLFIALLSVSVLKAL